MRNPTLDLQTVLIENLEQAGVAGPRPDVQHQDVLRLGAFCVLFEFVAISSDEVLRIVDDGQPPAATEQGHGRQFVVNVTPLGGGPIETLKRRVGVPQHLTADGAQSQPLEKRFVPEHDAEGSRPSCGSVEESKT